jgi:GT2 family glycosyltransferase
LQGDLVIETPDWLEHMLVHVQKAGVGAVGSLIVYDNGLIRAAGLALDPEAGAAAVGHRADGRSRGHFGLLAAERNVSAVSAACLMIRKSVFQEVNGFDGSRFERAFADVDLCLRLRARGYRHVFTPRARCVYQGRMLPRVLQRPDPRALAALKQRWHRELERDPYTFMSPLQPAR